MLTLKFFKKLVITITWVLLSGCGYQNTELPNRTTQSGQQETSNGEIDTDNISFLTVRNEVFTPACLQCHSNAAGNFAGINLESYDRVQPILDRIYNSVNSGFMPLGGALTDEQKELLFRWIAQGAKENSLIN